MDNQSTNFKNIGWLSLFSIVIGVALPALGLFLFKGAESAFFYQKSTFYYTLLSAALIGLAALITVSKKNNVKVFIFNPENSLFPSLSKILTFSNIFHFSIIFGLSLALISTVTQTFFVSLPSIEFQVTETGTLILSTEPAATAETFFMLFIYSSIFTVMSIFLKKKNITGYLFLSHVISIGFSTIFWIALHYARYGSTETALGSTFFFGFASSFLVALTGSVMTA